MFVHVLHTLQVICDTEWCVCNMYFVCNICGTCMMCVCVCVCYTCSTCMTCLCNICGTCIMSHVCNTGPCMTCVCNSCSTSVTFVVQCFTCGTCVMCVCVHVTHSTHTNKEQVFETVCNYSNNNYHNKCYTVGDVFIVTRT